MSMLFRSPKRLRRIIGIALVVLLVLSIVPGYIVELLWMDELGYAPVFWKILGLKVLLFVGAFVITAAFLGVNFWVLLKQMPPLWASRWAREGEPPQVGGRPLTRKRLRGVAGVVTVFLSLIFAASFAGNWEQFLRFTNTQPYGLSEPVFGLDVSFYMLRLPFIETLQSTVVGLAFLALLISGVVYLMMGEVDVQAGRLRIRPSVVRHLGANLILLLLGWTWGFFLDRYELLYTPSNVVHGAGYTDVHVTIPALWIVIIATLVLAVLVALNFRRYRFRLLAYGAGAYVLLLILALALAPAAVQQLSVEPNELELETPHLEHNIAFTREGFNLNKVERRSYPAQATLTLEDAEENEETLNNIRLWDPRLIIETYRQIQEIRTYYQFYDIDLDRYTIDGEYRQVMLSGRELTQNLPGQVGGTWVNRHLQYTHGYGAVANIVSEKNEDGTPILTLQDLPPQTEHEELDVDEPAIYYGEQTPTYRLVSTRAEEFDYPSGDENVYTHYQGTGGVPVSSFWRQLLFSWQFSDYNIILSDYLTEDSRIQFWNRLQERIRRIAPFLRLDADPYFVLSDRRQYWIQDAYTTGQRFPYSEPTTRQEPGLARGADLREAPFSYMRNSVKIVVDAYSGDVTFYVMDEDDPVLKVYREAFPSLFRPYDEMSERLQQHLRYPQDLFEVQAEKYRRYHMTRPQVFYNNEDLWERPQEHYGGQQTIMEPYYILARLPGEEQMQFMLMTPFTPENRDNMIGWMAAKSDPPEYGEIVVFELPKERLIYGPNQVESRIDQDTEISRQLTLWDQRGSQVIRGNLIVVPVEESFIYVEPVFLISQDLQLPQLQRVIAVHGDRVSMERTLDEALNVVLGGRLAGLEDQERMLVPIGGTAPEVEDARSVLRQARQSLQEGDFADFGRQFEELERLLDESAADTLQPPPPDTTLQGQELPEEGGDQQR